jgi:hypothetical protein
MIQSPDSTNRSAIGAAVIADAITAYRAALAGKPYDVCVAEGKAAYQAVLAEQSPPPQFPKSTNPAEDLYDFAALHCVELPTHGSDRDRALAAAAECFHLANWWPREADVAEQFLALAESLPDAPTSPEFGRSPTPPTSPQLGRSPGRQRQPSIRKLIEEAKKAGATITWPDGTKLDFGKAEQQGNEADEWIAKHASKTQGH